MVYNVLFVSKYVITYNGVSYHLIVDHTPSYHIIPHYIVLYHALLFCYTSYTALSPAVLYYRTPSILYVKSESEGEGEGEGGRQRDREGERQGGREGERELHILCLGVPYSCIYSITLNILRSKKFPPICLV